MDTPNEIIRKHAIQNRLKYGTARESVVLGKILSENPEFKKNLDSITKEIKKIVEEVNSLSKDELKDYKISKRSSEYKAELELPNNPTNVVMRFAPNPNGPPTLGGARGIIVNFELAKKYNGTFILRFDDTDPRLKRPLLEAYDWYIEDCEWLGAKPDKIIIASERIPLYYGYAEELIKLNKAYICFCDQKEFKKLKDSKKECIHRNSSIEENLKYWENMLSKKYSEKEAVLRIKTDIKNKNPALRDFVGFRILNEDHPKVGSRFTVWPTLDFESAIEDHLLGITHILRGKDLMNCEYRQKFIYCYFNWKYPETILWGRVSIEEFGKLSTSGIKKAIDEHIYSGWDDPKLPTIRALRRRGIKAEAIRNLMVNLGIGENDLSLSLENLYSKNRKIIDSVVNRYFFVESPVELTVENMPQKTVRLLLHPSFPERGFREYVIKQENNHINLFISKNDMQKIKINEIIKLIGLYHIKINEISPRVIAEYTKSESQSAKKIHWIQEYINANIVTPGGMLTGFCEINCKNLKVNDIIQFERFGFVRLDHIDDKLVFYFAHR